MAQEGKKCLREADPVVFIRPMYENDWIFIITTGECYENETNIHRFDSCIRTGSSGNCIACSCGREQQK